MWKSILWIMDSYLSAVRALILTAPIHYRWSISESKWCSFSKSDEEIHPSTSWITWGWVHFQHILIFWINFPLKDLIPKTTFKNEVTEEKRSCSIWDMQIRTLDINKCGFSVLFFLRQQHVLSSCPSKLQSSIDHQENYDHEEKHTDSPTSDSI